MKRIATTLLLFVITSLIARSDAHDNDSCSILQMRSLSPLSVRGGQGVSGAFAGTIGKNHRIIVAGGCNFPGIPAAEGGKKVFYGDIYEYVPSADGLETGCWKAIGALPETCAYGASVTTSEGIVCMGGMNESGSSDRVFMLFEDENGCVQQRILPSLPMAMDNMAAAYGDGYVYIAGGNVAGEAQNVAYRLSLADVKRWERLADFPGLPRVQPSAAVQQGVDGIRFYLIGGYYMNADKGEVVVHCDGVVYNPRTEQWRITSQATPFGNAETMAIVGAQAVSMGQSSIVCIGGVNKEIFQNALLRQALQASGKSKKSEVEYEKENYEYMTHPSEWYKFNDRLLVFDTITDTWSLFGQTKKLARAGASVVSVGSEIVIVCGEEKPGVRSSDVTCIKIDPFVQCKNK